MEKDNLIKKVKIIMKCFLILIIFGLILPKTIDYILYFILSLKKPTSDSVLVNTFINRSRNLLYYFTSIINVFLNYYF